MINCTLTIITYQEAVWPITQTSDSPVTSQLHFDNQSPCGHYRHQLFPSGGAFTHIHIQL